MKKYNYKKNKSLILTIVFFLFFIIINNIIINNVQAEPDQTEKIDWTSIYRVSKNSLQSDPDNVMANFHYSISLANLGKIEEAYDHFEVIKEKIKIKKFNEVLSPYIKELEEKPDDVLLLNYAAFSASINNKYKKSAVHFENLIKIDCKNVWIMNYLAATYLELKQYKKVLTLLKEAIKIKDNKYSHLLLGMAYYKQGNIFKALLEMSKSGNLISKFMLNK